MVIFHSYVSLPEGTTDLVASNWLWVNICTFSIKVGGEHPQTPATLLWTARYRLLTQNIPKPLGGIPIFWPERPWNIWMCQNLGYTPKVTVFLMKEHMMIIWFVPVVVWVVLDQPVWDCTGGGQKNWSLLTVSWRLSVQPIPSIHPMK